MKIGIDELKQLHEHTINFNGNQISLSYDEKENSIEIIFSETIKQEDNTEEHQPKSLTLELVQNENGTHILQETTDTSDTEKRTLKLNRDDFFRLLNAKPYSQSVLKGIYPLLDESKNYKLKLENWAKKYSYFIGEDFAKKEYVVL